MAFCVRSERKMDYLKTDKLEIGPGQYFQSNDKNYIKKRIHPPFQISSQRISLYNKNDNPGPGSYDLIDKSFNNKNSTYISTNKDKNYSTINNNNNLSSVAVNSVSVNNSSYIFGISKNTRNKKNISNYTKSEINDNNINIFKNKSFIYNNKNIPFLSKVKRFENNNKLLDNNEIGPGSYDLNKNIIKIDKNKNKLMNIPLKIEVGSLKRIISIPSKDMNGYSYDYNKNLKLIMDDQTDKNIYIGPGKYDVKIKEKPKSIIEWSKSFNIKEIKHKKEIMKKKETIEELKKQGDIISKDKLKIDHKNSKLLKTQNFGNNKKGLYDLNTKLFTNNMNKKINFFAESRNDFFINKNENPGPGYYTNDLIKFKLTKKNKKNNMNLNNICFGSSCNRFLYKSKSLQDIGPTTYFLEKNKYEPDKKYDIISHLKYKRLFDDNGKQKEIINNNNILSNIPGPGSYELSHSFINKSYNKYQIMNDTQIRFNYKINENPGPGAYTQINNNNNINKKINKIKKRINVTFEEEEKRKIERLDNIKKEKNIGIPGVGTYNIENIDSISNNIKMKLNQKLSYDSPFLMSSKRFNYKYEKEDYPIYNNNYKKINEKYIIFSKAKRFNDEKNKNNSEDLIGPGSYDLIKNNQWSKKTFNKLFSF